MFAVQSVIGAGGWCEMVSSAPYKDWAGETSIEGNSKAPQLSGASPSFAARFLGKP